MTGIIGALGAGYSASQILRYLSTHNPALGQKITAALNAGHTIDHVMNFLKRNGKALGNLVPDKDKTPRANNIYKTAQSDIHPSLKGMAQVGGAAALGAGAAYAMSHAIPRVLQTSLAQNIAGAPNVPNQPNPISPLAPTGQQGTTLGQAGQAQQAPTTQQTLQPPTNPVAPNLPQQAAPIQPEVKTIDLKEVLNKYPGFESKVNELLKTKNPPEAIAAYFKKFNASQTAKLEKELGKPIDQIIAEYASSVPEEETKRLLSKEEALGAFRNKQMIKHAQEETEKPNVNPLDNEKKALPGESAHEVHKRLKIGYADAAKLVDERDAIESPKIEKGATVASPQGVGEVKEIRNGKAMLEIDGKKHVVDESELESEPEDLEPAVRHILDSIPENQKSTAFESSIHITLPTGQDLMVTKFYNGKWAWYIDVPENLYEDIATGVYSPKTTGKTGIAEYKPGVIDSRGAGFQSEIVQNPKYGKNEKGKTWGYANSKYNALEMIQGIINKISKEKYDEEGNPIQRKKRKKSD